MFHVPRVVNTIVFIETSCGAANKSDIVLNLCDSENKHPFLCMFDVFVKLCVAALSDWLVAF